MFLVSVRRAMSWSQPDTWRYSLLRSKEIDHEDCKETHEIDETTPSRPWPRGVIVFLLIALFVAGIFSGTFWSTMRARHLDFRKDLEDHTASGSCTEPARRREWRSLSLQERTEYLTAVQCLTKHKSTLNPGTMMHDDFGWIHSHIGQYCKHYNAPELGFADAFRMQLTQALPS